MCIAGGNVRCIFDDQNVELPSLAMDDYEVDAALRLIAEQTWSFLRIVDKDIFCCVVYAKQICCINLSCIRKAITKPCNGQHVKIY